MFAVLVLVTSNTWNSDGDEPYPATATGYAPERVILWLFLNPANGLQGIFS